MNYLTIFFLVLGFFYSILLGSTAYIRDVHSVPWARNPKEYPYLIKVSQWILNWMGGMIGWIALGYLLHKFGLPYKLDFPESFNVGDFLLGLIMFYGINGKLPYILMQVANPSSVIKGIIGIKN
ncbi:MAG: hypothetical protein WC349_04555 [Patescibacteria group bacterium]|jgi:hypothetical protein